MKLNSDCVRDVLLYLEDNLTYIYNEQGRMEHNTIQIDKIIDNLHNQNKYESADVNYFIEKLFEIGFISSKNQSKRDYYKNNVLSHL